MRAAPLTIGVVAPIRHRIGEPHAGGLEAAVFDRVRMLRRRGHTVLLSAVEGSDPAPGPGLALPSVRFPSDTVPTDTSYPDGHLELALTALQTAMDRFADLRGVIDVIDNHSLHGVPLQRARELGVPMLTTLHTPPIQRMLDAWVAGGRVSRFAAVSRHTQREWESVGVSATLVTNAVDTATWRLGPGGPGLVWFGRIVPEKAPHLALRAAALAGLPITIAGRVGDVDYFEAEVAPQLNDAARFVGPLRAVELARLVGRSAAALVTPVWDEPFGLVVAEALATGTPVAAFDAGGVAEVIGTSPAARLAPMGDVERLAAGALELAHDGSAALRRATRADAVRRFSWSRHVQRVEQLLRATALDAGQLDALEVSA